ALFAVLPGALAWVVNQVGADVVAALGMVVLLRGHKRSWAASGLGAGAFTFGGFMAAQSVHIDLVIAGGLLVWAFAAVDRIAGAPRVRAALGWTAVLGLSIGLMALSGAAEPLLDGGVALALYALWRLGRAKAWAERAASAAHLVCGLAVGALVGGAQLLPGSVLQAQSQRSLHSFGYFTSGSLNKSLTILGLDPLLLGSAHSSPITYFGTYNLPEISSYVGIMAVMGVVGLLASRHRHSAVFRDVRIWYLIGGLALVLAWGSFTPLGHIEYWLPLYNRQRLLSRNLLVVDLAMAVLFATWLDMMLFRPIPDSDGARPRRRWSSDVVLPLLPVAGVVGLQVALVAGGPWLPHVLHVPGAVRYGTLWKLMAFLTVPSLSAMGAGWLVVRTSRHGSSRRTMHMAAVLLVADLGFFNLMVQELPPTGTSATGDPSLAAQVAAAVTAAGRGQGGERHRFALYDPGREYPIESDDVGQPDMNILLGLSSVQGYGAIVDAGYDSATGTHQQGSLLLGALADGTLTSLDLGVLVTVPENFVSLVVAPASSPESITPGATPLPPVPPDLGAPVDNSPAPPTPAGDFSQVPSAPRSAPLETGSTTTFFFGTDLSVRSVTVPVASAPSGVTFALGLLAPSGRAVKWLTVPSGIAVHQGRVQVHVPGAPDAAGIVVEPLSPGTPVARVEIGPAVVDSAGQGVYRLDGPLADFVTGPQWNFVSSLDGGRWAVLRTPQAAGRVALAPVGGSARITSDTPWGTESILVRSATAVTLVRNVSFATGWQATISTASGVAGHGVGAVVQRHGLVQAVAVPAGVHVVTFRYRPHRVVEGLVASATGILGLLGLVIASRRDVRRRRKATGAPSSAVR
ncbi:MAG: hypothetical protein ACYDD4_04765, partial [Acidimicrobiales bacterium]